jgi:DNA repair protein RadD
MRKALVTAFHNMGMMGLGQLMNPAILELVCEFDHNPDTKFLADTILDLYDLRDLMGDSNKRKLIFEHLLKEDAAEILGRQTGLVDSNPWSKLMELQFSGSFKQVVFEYFEISSASNDKNITSNLPPSTTIIKSDYALFLHQEIAAYEVKNCLSKDSSRVLLHMPTGAGKTRTAMHVICDYLRNTGSRTSSGLVIWLADTEELCEQAAQEFERAWKAIGIGETKLYRFYGDYDQELEHIQSGFMVAGLAKLNCYSGQTGLLNLGTHTSLVVFDEAHKVLAETYHDIVELFQTTGDAKLIGLSATPGRSTFDHDQNIRFAEFFQYNKVTLEVDGYKSPIDYLQAAGYIAKTNYHDIPYSPEDLKFTLSELNAMASGNDIPTSIVDRLGIDTKRNIKIVNAALDAVNNGKYIIIFSCSVENAEALQTLLLYKKVSSGLVTSNTEKNFRRDIIQKYKNRELSVLVNYGVLTTGFDAPNTNVAIIARPTKSLTLYSQMVGRAARGERAGGNKECEIYTVVDDLPGYKSLSEAFKYWDDAWDCDEQLRK